MGTLLIIIVLALGGFALFAWYMQGYSADDRSDKWWIFERQSGPFYWRKQWMRADEKTFEEHKAEYEQAKFEDEMQKLDLTSNIRVKQKQEDWDDLKKTTDKVLIDISQNDKGNGKAVIKKLCPQETKLENHSLTEAQIAQILDIIRGSVEQTNMTFLIDDLTRDGVEVYDTNVHQSYYYAYHQKSGDLTTLELGFRKK